MTTYTVHEALIPPRELDRRADDIVFVKEGFSWWAFLAPLPWLLYRRLWLETLAYVFVAVRDRHCSHGIAPGEAGCQWAKSCSCC